MIHDHDIITQQTKVTSFIHAKVSMHPRSWVVGAMWHAEGSSLYVYPLPMVCIAVHLPIWATRNQLIRWLKSPTPWLFLAVFVMLPLGVIIGWMTHDRVEPVAAPSASISSTPRHEPLVYRVEESPKQAISLQTVEDDAGASSVTPSPSAVPPVRVQAPRSPSDSLMPSVRTSASATPRTSATPRNADTLGF